MNKRSLGRTGLAIAPIVFGGNVLGWTIDEKTSFGVLDAFVDLALTPLIPPMSIRSGRPAIMVENLKR